MTAPSSYRTVAVAVAVFLFTALIHEFFADRYGASSFGSSLPGGPLLARLSNITNILALATAAMLILRSQVVKRSFVSGNRVGAPGVSQLHIWWPYACAWAFGAIFGAQPGVAGYSIVSLVMVLAIASVRAIPSAKRLIDETARWSLRMCVCFSLALGLILPNRAFAPYLTWPGGWREGVDRLQGVFPHPNTLGWVAALAIAFELLGPRRRDRIFFVGGAIAALYLTGSRTATIALAAGLCVAFLFSAALKGSAAKSVAVGVAPFAITIAIGIAGSTGLSADTFNGREATWQAAWNAFLDNWVSGSGPGAYLSESSAVAYAHNQLLQSVSELGVVGLFALVAHIVLLFRVVTSQAANVLGYGLLTMWFVAFLSENLLRFADPGFVPQILLFQLCLLSAMTREAAVWLPERQVGKIQLR